MVLGSLRLTQLLLNQINETVSQSRLSPNESAYHLQSIINSPDRFGNTPLLYAVLHKHHLITKTLLETKVVNPSIQDNTLIRWTLKWGNEELLKLMVGLPRFNAALARRQFGGEINKYLVPPIGQTKSTGQAATLPIRARRDHA